MGWSVCVSNVRYPMSLGYTYGKIALGEEKL